MNHQIPFCHGRMHYLSYYSKEEKLTMVDYEYAETHDNVK